MGIVSARNCEVASPRNGIVGRLLFSVIVMFFFVSGACGLLYEVVWTRKLVLLFGTTAYAVSTVLFIFFLGLGLGSLWGGRLAEQYRRPLFLYGLFEIGVGVWAFLFILLVDWGEGVVVGALRAFASTRWAAVGLRVVLSLGFLIVPVTLMGATLPLLAKFVAAQRRVAGLRIGALYSLNTFGAVAGCAITGFYLIAAFGYTRATLMGALANVAIGTLAVLVDRLHGARHWRAGVDTRPAQSISSEEPPSRGIAVFLLTTYAVSGFCALALEVLWTRLLTILFTGTTYAFTTMLASLLCGIAIGSAVSSLAADRCRNPVLIFGLTEGLAGIACLFTLSIFVKTPSLFAELSLEAGYQWAGLVRAKFLVCFLVLFLPTFLFGATMPMVVKAFAGYRGRMGRDVGVLYGANTCGGVFGALAGGFLLVPLLGTQKGIAILSLGLFTFGVIVSCLGLSRSRPAYVAVALIAIAVFVWGAKAAQQDVGRALTLADIPEHDVLIHYQEGIEGTVAVSQEPAVSLHGNRVLWINGVQATASIERGVKMNRFQAALPLLFDREPRAALVMCFGSGITCGTLAQYGLDRVDAVEISPDVLEAADLFSQDNLRVMQNPRVRFIVDDGRNFLLTTTNHYDLITFEPMPLALAGVSTFYTREYYQLCLGRLNPGGLVSQWVPLHSLNLEVIRSLIRTFTCVFPDYCAWFINADLFLIGSDQPLALDYVAASKRIAQPPLRDALAAVELEDPIELLSGFFMGKSALDRFAANAPIMTDDRPWAEFEAPKLMYRRAVDESLEVLLPYHESPTSLLKTTGLSREDADRVLAALDRRYRARQEDLRGVMVYYGGLVLANAEEAFLNALKIDPGDRTAVHYLRQLAQVRTELYLKWQTLEQAREYLENLVKTLPHEAVLPLLLGDVYQAKAEWGKARKQYERYLALGGLDPRAREYLESSKALTPDAEG